MISDAARTLLVELVGAADSAKLLRPIGDSRLGQALQSSGLATMNHVDAKTIRITPTQNGRNWVALLMNHAEHGRHPTHHGIERKGLHHG